MPINKTVKRIILGFTILCSIFLIFFLVELIRLNRDSGDRDSGAAMSEGSQNGNGGGAEPDRQDTEASGGDGSDQSPDGNMDVRPPAGNQRPAPTGTRHESDLPESMKLVFYADRDLFNHFEHEEEYIPDILRYRGTGTAELQVHYIMITGDIKTYAQSYLAVNFGVNEPEFSVADYIGLSQLRGVMVFGANDGLNYEAWLHSFTKPGAEDLGLAFILSYQNNEQKAALYDVLDSMDVT